MTRSEFSTSVRNAAWKRCDGKCEWPECGIKLRPGHFAFDHKIADGLGGEPTLDNCQVLCDLHHDKKTFTEDNPRMTKADNQAKAIFGTKRSSNPVPGSRNTAFKRHMDGRVTRR